MPRPVLVGLAHPVSNIRPVICVRAQRARSSRQSTHPYPTEEFDSSRTPSFHVGNYSTSEWFLEDSARHAHDFWYDSNTRFHAAKQAIIDSHSCLHYANESSRQPALESALSRFYRGWLNQERNAQQRFTESMYMRIFHGIRIALKEKWLSRWV